MVEQKKKGLGGADIANLIGTLGGLVASVGFGDHATAQQIPALVNSIAGIADKPRRTSSLQGALQDTPDALANQDLIESLLGVGELGLAAEGITRGLSQKPGDPMADMLAQALGLQKLETGQVKLDQLNADPSGLLVAAQKQQLKTEGKQQVEQFKAVEPGVRNKITELDDFNNQLSFIENKLQDPKVQNELIASRTLGGGAVNNIKKFFVTKAGRSEAGRIAAQQASPELFELSQGVEQALQFYGKSISGAAISEQEFERLRQTIFSVVDQPEVFKKRLANLGTLNKIARLDRIAGSRSRDVEALGFARDEVDSFIQWKQLKNKPNKTKQEKDLLQRATKGLGFDFSL